MTNNRKDMMSPPKKMTEKVLRRVKLADNREVRIVRIPTGFGENLIRVGINTLPDGANMSGAVFPESYLGDVIEALQAVDQ
jgi:hypothetical protein